MQAKLETIHIDWNLTILMPKHILIHGIFLGCHGSFRMVSNSLKKNGKHHFSDLPTCRFVGEILQLLNFHRGSLEVKRPTIWAAIWANGKARVEGVKVPIFLEPKAPQN